MKTAITVWGNRLSPLCDSARWVLIVDIDKGRITNRRKEAFQSDSPFHHAVLLANFKVEVLICGAITEPLANTINARSIQIIPFITGTVDQVLDAYARDKLDSPEFRMPGCGGRRNRGFKKRFGGSRFE